MARDGSGDYTRVAGPYTGGSTILKDNINDELDDIANALSGSPNINGTKPFAADQPMGGYNLTQVGSFSSPLGPLQDASQQRLSLTTALPVTTGDITSAATIYMTPAKGNRVSLWDGSYWHNLAQVELSLALSSNSGHTNYHQSGKNFDVFYFDDNGTKRIGTGPAWTSDTGRGSGAGTTEISRLSGVLVNVNSIVLRFGSASGNTVAVAANRATYLGTFRCSADGQTEDSRAKRFLWNYYNRLPRAMRVLEGTDSWSGSGAASWRQMNNSAANQLAFVAGAGEDRVRASALLFASNSTSTFRGIRCGIGIDATNAFADGCLPGDVMVDNNAFSRSLSATYDGFPGVGYHFLAALEYDNAADTRTYAGDAGAPTVLQSGITGEVMA